jgi:hypothetical protein
MRWLLCSMLLVLSSTAAAHRFAPSLLEIEQLSADRFAVSWKTPVDTVTETPLAPLLPAGCAETERSPWIMQGTGRLQQLTWQCAGGLVGETIRVDGIAANKASVLLTLRLTEGIAHQQVLTPDSPSYTVPLEPDAKKVVTQYTVLGAEHIWLGIDHLLFVLGLLLLVGQGRRLIWTVTAFTVGHSMTLAMVTLGWFTYPVALIEFLIALSIFVLAVELTREQGISRLWRQPWWLAGLFGLLHGMGFAGALAETGLPQSNLPLALLFFNLGIEFGQLAFIGVLLLIGAAIRKVMPTRATALASIPVAVLGVLSAMWCIERGLEVIS